MSGFNDKGLKLLTKGSNKDIYELEKHPQHLLFKMSSRISVFDVGALDDDITERAQSLERFAQSVALHLASKGVPQAWDKELSSEYQGFVQKRVAHAKIPSRTAEELSACALVGSALPMSSASSELILNNIDGDKPLFVPLEVIVRWGVPVGSSLVKKDPNRYPLGSRFETPTVDYTTKLEAQDRALDNTEAQSLCPEGLKLASLEKFVLEVAAHLKSFFGEKGLEVWDAKFELAWDAKKESLLLVDAVTPDELRLTLKGLDKVPLSKELLRFWLRQTAWYEDVLVAKAKGGNSWRDQLSPAPRLGAWRLNFLSKLYIYLADQLENSSSSKLFSLLRGSDASVPQPKICILGKGGREEALRWRFAHEGCEIVKTREGADAVFVSMDDDLAAGLADKLREQRVWTFGPSQAASKLEWSKLFGREIANLAQVPTPKFSKKLEDIYSVASSSQFPVVKMDGLASGKGVFLPDSKEALDEIVQELNGKRTDFIFEERCSGEEASAFFMIERDAWGREKARFLGSAKDFKRRYLGDEGPNTGGMGAYAPHPSLKPEDVETFRNWALATARCMQERGEAFRGILYMGFMRDPKKGWVLIEYNSRFGDPETQALVALWPEHQAIARSLVQLTPMTEFAEAIESETKSLCLALVHPEYPKSCAPLDLEEWSFTSTSEVQLFQTGSRTGRIAYLVGQGPSFLDAGDKVFDALLDSPWKDNIEWRSDILR